MGGRVASMVAAADGALGLLLLAYPLHAPGRSQDRRADHFPKLSMPVLFVSGTRDSFGAPDELRDRRAAIRGRVTWQWIETGDHSFRPLKKQTGMSTDDALAAATPVVDAWVASL